MGILNVTPDSFFDGGRYEGASASCARVDALLAEGADLIDIGGESTRPGAPSMAPSVQIERIGPALRYALSQGATVSVDTTSPEVAAHALELGAQIINDVSCLANPALAEVVAAHQATLVLMHARGPMAEMAGFSQYPDGGYQDVVDDVRREWRAGRDRALAAGVANDKLWFDPGLGFNKNAKQSLALLARLDEFSSEGVPIVIGASRKSFIADVDGTSPADRLGGSIAACLLAMKLGANVLRVHDVQTTRQALVLTAAAEAVRSGVRGV
ncbi:MAG TPA: dihydropteroate synthase [Polyangiaceae bacterium]|nr:dihydropteroate synthase [Polyangiaceae bacterium]